MFSQKPQHVTKSSFFGGGGGNSVDGNAEGKAEPSFVRGQSASPSVRREGGDAALRPCWGRSQLRSYPQFQLRFLKIPPQFSEKTDGTNSWVPDSESQPIWLKCFSSVRSRSIPIPQLDFQPRQKHFY